MTGSGLNTKVARLVSGATLHNTLNSRTVELFFQKSPGVSEGDDRGIANMSYRITSNGQEVASGTTESDGKIEVPFHQGTAMVLEVMHAGAAVARYQLALRDDPFEAGGTFLGVQRRLRQLGYQLGKAGPARDGVDGAMGARTDKAIQDFQIDTGLAFDSIAAAATQRALSQAVGGSAQNG